MTRAPPGSRTMPDGSVIETKALVERIRKFRGRLTAQQIARIIGLPGWSGVMSVKAMCAKFEITTADEDADYRPGVVHRDALVLLAQEALANEIRLAKADAHRAPLYRVWPP